MNVTPYQAKYFAHELTKRHASDSAEKLAGAVASAQVDLNPHQVDAALFAFNSPLAKGEVSATEQTEKPKYQEPCCRRGGQAHDTDSSFPAGREAGVLPVLRQAT